ncbi:MAG TPA: aldehyde dehydrogenase family protein [Bacillota bacterium]
MNRYLNFIDGEWVKSHSNQRHEHFNPAKPSESIGVTEDSTVEDGKQAVTAAVATSRKWKTVSSVTRGDILQKAAHILEERADEIARTATLEMGKRFAETKGEAIRGASILRYYAQEGYRQVGEVLPSAHEGSTILAVRVPVGVVAAITPWNFPIAIPIWKLAPALLYGNTVVWKPSREAGITATKIAKVFEDAGLPKGVLNLINGSGSVIGNYLTTHKEIDAVTFTGSNAVGQTIAQQATASGKKFQLELGGKNPAVVLADANLDVAARLVVDGAMKQTGQRCTATSRTYVEAAVYDTFLQKVIEYVKQIKVGDGLQDEVTMGPLASKHQFDTVTDYIKRGVEEGATLVYGGNPLHIHGGYFIEPTIFSDVTEKMTIAKEEIFGPVVAIMKVDNYEEALERANDTMYGLSAAIFTQRLEKAYHFMEHSEVGLVQVNGETGGAEPQAPFGGLKASGAGPKEQGQAAKEFFTNYKTITIHPFAK